MREFTITGRRVTEDGETVFKAPMQGVDRGDAVQTFLEQVEDPDEFVDLEVMGEGQ